MNNKDIIILNELDNSNNWKELSRHFKFTYEDIVRFKNSIGWYI